jgi:hypothetical protein
LSGVFVEMASISDWMAVSVPELCADFSKIPYHSSAYTENDFKALSLVRLVTNKIHPQLVQDTG